ncbi:MAG: hypothetical protein AAB426_01215 [Myxococcota bacterium]
MKKSFLSGLLAVVMMPAAAMAEGESAGLGIDAGIDLAYGAPAKAFDDAGKSADLPYDLTTMAVIMNGGYDLGAMVPGLYAGLQIPAYVSNAISLAGQEASESGLGEISLFGRYMFPAVPDMLKVGGQLRFKAGTGKGVAEVMTGDAESVTGSGFHNLQLSILADAMFSGVGVHADVGYLMTIAKGVSLAPQTDSVSYNPGDLIFANVSVGYALLDGMVEPRLTILFGTGTETSVDGTSAPDSGVQYLGVALDVLVKVNERLNAHLAFGLPQIGFYGNNLPYGYIITGKNVLAGGYGLTVGASTSF